jgi:hypothetical protein
MLEASAFAGAASVFEAAAGVVLAVELAVASVLVVAAGGLFSPAPPDPAIAGDAISPRAIKHVASARISYSSLNLIRRL